MLCTASSGATLSHQKGTAQWRRHIKDLKHLIRDPVRTAIHSTLSSVIQEATEEELRTALPDPAFKDPLMQVVRVELQRAIEGLHRNGSGSRSKSKR